MSRTVVVRILRTMKDAAGGPSELLRRWMVIGAPGVAPARDDLTMLGKKGAEDALRQWKFLTENVVADNDGPQENGKEP